MFRVRSLEIKYLDVNKKVQNSFKCKYDVQPICKHSENVFKTVEKDVVKELVHDGRDIVLIVSTNKGKFYDHVKGNVDDISR